MKEYKKRKLDDKMEKYMEEFIERYNINYRQKEKTETYKKERTYKKNIIFLIRKKKKNLILMNMV